MALRRGLLEQVRRAIRESDKTSYRIAIEAEVDEGNLCRFVNGGRGFSVESLERICAAIGFEIVLAPIARGGRRKNASKGS